MASNLEFEGTYADGEQGRPLRRFVVHNWTSEDLHSQWDSKPIFIKAGEMYECGHAVAYKLTKELVDRELFREAEKAPNAKERERKEMSILSPIIRHPLEQKTLTEIMPGAESPVIAKLREEIRAEERAKIEAKPKPIKRKAGEFDGLSTVQA